MYYSYSLVWLYSLSQLLACFAVCQFVRLSTPEPHKITVKVRSKPKYFSDIILETAYFTSERSTYEHIVVK